MRSWNVAATHSRPMEKASQRLRLGAPRDPTRVGPSVKAPGGGSKTRVVPSSRRAIAVRNRPNKFFGLKQFFMGKKPQKVDFTVVGNTSEPGLDRPGPPRKLGKLGLSVWNSLQAEFHITDAGGIELLAQACAAVDRAEALRARIDGEGETIGTRAARTSSTASALTNGCTAARLGARISAPTASYRR